MKNKTLFSAIVSLALMTGGSAFAQDNHRQNERDHQDNRGEHGQDRNQGNDDHGQDRRNDRANYESHDRGGDRGDRGAGPRHDMRRGQRISNEYRGNQYVVSDWRAHHLSAPPRGQHWVQTGGDYVLVAIASGIIAQILLNN